MLRLTRKSNSRGFTLVELLIVIAIIGILSTIGIPAFRRMVQKSKKVEAKTSLGGLYTAEQAFFSEYGAFGNNLYKVGFVMDSSQNNQIYAVGFPTSTCAGQTSYNPSQTGTIGTSLNTIFPTYYTVGMGAQVGTSYTVGASLLVRSTATGGSSPIYTNCSATVLPAAYTFNDGGSSGTTVGVISYAPQGAAAAGDSNGYIASATGLINQQTTAGAATLAQMDIWQIDQERNLRNVQDGVK